METLQLKDIAAYLPYKLRFKGFEDMGIIYEIEPTDDNLHFINSGKYSISQITPILKPISDLNKPLEDGSIPIVELAKICYRKAGYNAIIKEEKCYVINNWGAKLYRFYFDMYHKSFYSMTLFVVSSYGDKETKYSEDRDVGVHNQIQLFDYLNEHHFDYRNLIGRNLAIDINTIE